MMPRTMMTTLAALALFAPVTAQEDAVAPTPAETASATAEDLPIEGARAMRVGSFLAASGEDVRLPAEGAWRGNVHLAGGAVDVLGRVEGDLLAAGAALTLGGHVTGDAGLAGQTVRADGRVDGDLRIAGQNVEIGGRVGGDLVGFAQRVRVGTDASVAGPALLFGGFVTVVGEIRGPAQLAGGEVVIDGPIRGDVSVRCDQLRLGESARIEGTLEYDSKNDVEIPEGMVTGEVRRIERTVSERVEELAERGEAASALLSPFRVVLGFYMAAISLLTGILVWLLFEGLVRGALARASSVAGFGSSAVVGLVVGLGAVAIAGACFLLGPLWLAIVFASLALFFFGGVVGRMILGRALLRPIVPDAHPLLALLAGLVALALGGFLIGLVPWVGGLAAFLLRAAVVVGGVGAIVQELRGRGVPPGDAAA